MNLKRYIKNPKLIAIPLLTRYGGFIPEKPFLKMLYRLKMGHPLNLNNPESFTEKLQWLKLYDRNPQHTALVDKDAVKAIVADKIGAEHVIPTLGKWDSVESIDWGSLPDKFVLKTTHGGGGGGVVICKDKSKLDKAKAKATLNRSMKIDLYPRLREWPYKNVPKRIIAEEFIDGGEELKDYKFYCFNGEVKYVLVVQGRFGKQKCYDYFDLNWNHLDFCDTNAINAPQLPKKPENFDKMVEIAKNLSQDIPHVRIDLYNVDGKIYFGEYTFFDASGFARYNPPETDLLLGKHLMLPKPYN